MIDDFETHAYIMAKLIAVARENGFNCKAQEQPQDNSLSRVCVAGFIMIITESVHSRIHIIIHFCFAATGFEREVEHWQIQAVLW